MSDEPEPTQCECGQPLDTHPPLPKARPLTSWMAQKSTTDKYQAKSGMHNKAISLGRKQS